MIGAQKAKAMVERNHFSGRQAYRLFPLALVFFIGIWFPVLLVFFETHRRPGFFLSAGR